MSRWGEIRRRLRVLDESGVDDPDDLAGLYEGDVRYLVRRIESYGPPLRSKLQAKGLDLAAAQRRSRRRAIIIATIGLALTASLVGNFILAQGGLGLLNSPESVDTAAETGDPVRRPQVSCLEWTPVDSTCSTGQKAWQQECAHVLVDLQGASIPDPLYGGEKDIRTVCAAESVSAGVEDFADYVLQADLDLLFAKQARANE